MSDKKGTSKLNSLTAGLAAVTTALTLAQPVIDAVSGYVDKTIEERKNLVTMPELYSREYPLKVEQAEKLLEENGLKATFVPLSINDASAKYRTCFDSQVIKTNPRAKQKVDPGKSVLVKYITQEVIDESRRLYAEAQQKKQDIAMERKAKRSEQKGQIAQAFNEAVDITKKGIKKIPSIIHKSK